MLRKISTVFLLWSVFSTSSAIADVNLIREYGQINTIYDDELESFPFLGIVDSNTGEYLEDNYDFLGIDDAGEEPADRLGRITGVELDEEDYDCTTGYWTAEQILCDEGSTRNSRDIVSRAHESVGITYEVLDTDNPFDSKAFVVIDLQSVKTFHLLQIYQMFSDGKVTHVELFVNPNSSNQWPTYWDSGWTQVVERSLINEGAFVEDADLEDGSILSQPTNIAIPSASSRYIMLAFYNDGTHGDPRWIEVGGVKLFGETGKDTAFWNSVENCRLSMARSLSAGSDVSTSTYQSCFFTGVNSSNAAAVNSALKDQLARAAASGTAMSHADLMKAAAQIADRLDLIQRLSTGKLVYAAEFTEVGIDLGANPTRTLDTLQGMESKDIDTLDELLAQIRKVA
jgi:hypothetical protein